MALTSMRRCGDQLFGGTEGRRSLTVTPSGKVLPCHDAGRLLGLNSGACSNALLEDFWTSSPAFSAFRGLPAWTVLAGSPFTRRRISRDRAVSLSTVTPIHCGEPGKYRKLTAILEGPFRAGSLGSAPIHAQKHNIDGIFHTAWAHFDIVHRRIASVANGA